MRKKNIYVDGAIIDRLRDNEILQKISTTPTTIS